jgi:hypothetical protein
MAGKRSRASNRKKKTPGGGEEDVEAHQGLEGEGNTAEEEIGAVRRSSGGSSGVAALRTKEREGEWCGVKRRPGAPFIGLRRERKGRPRRWRELDRPAINGGGGGSGSGGACGGEEEVQEARGECEGAAAGPSGVLL